MKIKKNSVVSKTPISSSNMTPVQKIIFSMIFLCLGGYIQGVSLDLFPFKGKINAPREVIFLCGFIFFSAGVLVFLQGMSRVVNQKFKEKKYRSARNSPWLWDYRWNRRGIANRSKNSIVSHFFGVSIMLSFWGITYWIGFMVKDGFKIPFYGVSLMMLFILLWFYTMISKRIKYGRAYLSFLEFPYFLGEDLKIRFENLPSKEKVGDIFVTLRFYEENFLKDAKGRTRIYLKELYENEVKFNSQEISSSNSLEVGLSIPNEKKLTSKLSECPASFWEVQISCDIKGMDYREYFLLPIYSK